MMGAQKESGGRGLCGGARVEKWNLFGKGYRHNDMEGLKETRE
jgi:hypothetical protein